MKVAVVGNSGNLLHKKGGEFIDNHDVIIRFNESPIMGYRKYVGTRTDIRFIAYSERSANLIYQYSSCYVYSYSYKLWEAAISSLPFSTKLDENFINKCDKRVGRPCWKWKLLKMLGFDQVYEYKPISSIGFKGIMWALENYDEVNLFGFDFAESSVFHYWEDMPEGHNPGTWHNYKKEKEIILRLRDEGTLKIF